MPSSDNSLRAADVLAAADWVLVGAGAGLSAAAGLNYGDPAFFEPRFPGYRERYGIRDAYEGAFYPFPNEEELWAYWARHIGSIRYDAPAGQPYLDLLQLLAGKDFFVLTTNVDGQFAKAGFPADRLCTPQGDYALFQCAEPCRPEVFPNREWVARARAALGEGVFSVPKDLVPRCPHCGGPVFPNLRKDGTFVETPWREGWTRLEAWQKRRSGRGVLLELGVGFNTPAIIRYPFEAAMRNSGLPLVRLNPDGRLRTGAEVPDLYHSVTGNLGPVLAAWAARA